MLGMEVFMIYMNILLIWEKVLIMDIMSAILDKKIIIGNILMIINVTLGIIHRQVEAISISLKIKKNN